MHFENEAEAYLALASLVISADQVGTTPERNYLFKHIHGLEIFRDLSTAEFSRLMDYVNEKIFASYNTTDGLLAPDNLHAFCLALRTAIPVDRHESAMRMACEMACADGLLHVERRVLDALCSGFGLPADAVNRMLP